MASSTHCSSTNVSSAAELLLAVLRHFKMQCTTSTTCRCISHHLLLLVKPLPSLKQVPYEDHQREPILTLKQCLVLTIALTAMNELNLRREAALHLIVESSFTQFLLHNSQISYRHQISVPATQNALPTRRFIDLTRPSFSALEILSYLKRWRRRNKNHFNSN